MRIFVALVGGGRFPERKTSGAACYDCYARLEEGSVSIPSGTTVIVPLGFRVELPENSELQIRPRSGLTSRGILSAFGTVDSDYRGEVCAVLTNTTPDTYVVKDGDRVAQAAFRSYFPVTCCECALLSDTERGFRGFGSTGV